MIIKQQPILSTFNLQALLLFDITETERDYLKRVMISIGQLDPTTMTSLVAASSLHSYLAGYQILNKNFTSAQEDFLTKLLHRLIDLQITDGKFAGAFVRSQQQPEIKIEYLIHGTNALLQYLRKDN